MVASADKMIIRTNRETIAWLTALSSQNLTMRQNLEEATIFFGRFAGDHRSFGSWKDGFIRKQKKIKFEAQQRIRRDVGGLGKQFYTSPSEYSPPVQNLNLLARI